MTQKQTAMQECILQLKSEFRLLGISSHNIDFDELLAKEREQIMEAYDEAYNNGSSDTGNFEWGIRSKRISADTYYSQTFKTKLTLK